MGGIVPHDEWPIEENLFSFKICNSMFFPVLTAVAVIPFKPSAFHPGFHVYNDYTQRGSPRSIENRGASASPPNEILLRRPGLEAASGARRLIDRSRRLLEKMHPDDKDEAIGLQESIETAIDAGDPATLEKAMKDLGELLFFVEGQ